MVFKAASGAYQTTYKAYNSREPYAEINMTALNVAANGYSYYKNRIVLNRSEFAATEVSRI